LIYLAMLLAAPSHAESNTPIRVGFGVNKPPYVMEADRSGLEVELVNAAFQAAGRSVEPYFAPHERLFALLAHHHIDAIATTNEASGIVAYYSDNHITYQNYAIALADRPDIAIKTLSDLSRYRIASFQGARNILGQAYRDAVDHASDYSEQAQQSQRNVMLFRGRVDVVIADKRIFEYFRQHAGPEANQHRPVHYFAVFPPTQYKLGFDRQADREQFNAGLAQIRKNGIYDKVLKKYAAY
jgi:polar amino acid transport system substrate-binding protein